MAELRTAVIGGGRKTKHSVPPYWYAHWTDAEFTQPSALVRLMMKIPEYTFDVTELLAHGSFPPSV